MDLAGIRSVIGNAKANIAIMQGAISAERKTIVEYSELIGKGKYDDERLEAGIAQAKVNILKFEATINRDQDTIRENREIVKILEERERIKNGITVKIERDE